MWYVSISFPLVLIYLSFTFSQAIESYRFVNRKERLKEKSEVKTRRVLQALFYREITILWRDKLFFSFVFTSIGTALFTGYLMLYGTDILIPETLRTFAKEFLPSMFVFFGVYVVTVYTSVFPSLNLFLNEEKTMWILRNLPVPYKTIVQGKVLALCLCFLTALPFIFFMSLFVGIKELLFLLWFLVVAFLAGSIISLPLGARYVGKKSDILLLYSVALLVFVFLGAIATIHNVISLYYQETIYIFYICIVGIEAILFVCSLQLSSRLLLFNS
jgi:hypothetical protein